MADIIKSVMNSDREILESIRELYLDNDIFDLDPAYSIGSIYKNTEKPRYKFDINPMQNDVVKNDILEGIQLKEKSIKSIVFDPPFMFGTHGKTYRNVMKKRFTMFETFDDLEKLYKKALEEFYRILISGGILAFKSQDYTDSKTTLTHCYVWQWAIEYGFKTEDIFIKFVNNRLWNKSLKQRHSRKFHTYWFVFRK
jgi:tRNA G10  N-methylase Trm11